MKRYLFFSVVVLAASVMTSCHSNYRAKAYSNTSGWNYSGGNAVADGRLGTADVLQLDETAKSLELYDKNEEKDKKKNESGERMINYNATVHLDVKNKDTALSKLTAVAKKFDGYVSGSGSSYITLRVRAESLQTAITEVATFGKITSKSITGNDVTDQYTDLRMRLENAEKSRQRYLDLLSKAVSVTEILPIERELERLSLEIERIKGTMNRLENDHAFSYLTVYVNKPKKPGVVGYVFVGLFKGVKWLFVRG